MLSFRRAAIALVCLVGSVAFAKEEAPKPAAHPPAAEEKKPSDQGEEVYDPAHDAAAGDKHAAPEGESAESTEEEGKSEGLVEPEEDPAVQQNKGSGIYWFLGVFAVLVLVIFIFT